MSVAHFFRVAVQKGQIIDRAQRHFIISPEAPKARRIGDMPLRAFGASGELKKERALKRRMPSLRHYARLIGR